MLKEGGYTMFAFLILFGIISIIIIITTTTESDKKWASYEYLDELEDGKIVRKKYKKSNNNTSDISSIFLALFQVGSITAVWIFGILYAGVFGMIFAILYTLSWSSSYMKKSGTLFYMIKTTNRVSGG